MVLRFITDNPGLWAFHCRMSDLTASTIRLWILTAIYRLGVAYGRRIAHADQQLADEGGAARHPTDDYQPVRGKRRRRGSITGHWT